MTCEVRNCYNQTNETVTCAKSPMRNEPCTCRRIRSFLRRNDIGIDNVQMQCNQQSCNVSCDDGFIGDNVMYLCNDTSNCCTPIGDQEIVCKRGLLILKIMCIIAMYITIALNFWISYLHIKV